MVEVRGGEPAGRRRWSLGAVLGAAMGAAPHLLHHAGLFAGTALLAGLGGTVLFGALGLAAMLPMLLRLRRRFGGWVAPGLAVAAFAAMFAASTLLIGPALRSGAGEPKHPGPVPSAPPAGEQSHRGPVPSAPPAGEQSHPGPVPSAPLADEHTRHHG